MEENNKFLRHFKRWESFYNFIGHMLVFSALIFTAIGLYLSKQALQDSNASIKLTREALTHSEQSLQIQKEEFQLRNRPVVIIRNIKFVSEDTKSKEGIAYKHSVVYELTNSSEIPANNMLLIGTAYLNNKKIKTTISGAKSLTEDVGMISLPKNHTTKGMIHLETPIFQKAISSENHFRIQVEATYSGMLGEPNDAYKTVMEMEYSSVEKQFKIIKSLFK